MKLQFTRPGWSAAKRLLFWKCLLFFNISFVLHCNPVAWEKLEHTSVPNFEYDDRSKSGTWWMSYIIKMSCTKLQHCHAPKVFHLSLEKRSIQQAVSFINYGMIFSDLWSCISYSQSNKEKSVFSFIKVLWMPFLRFNDLSWSHMNVTNISWNVQIV